MSRNASSSIMMSLINESHKQATAKKRLTEAPESNETDYTDVCLYVNGTMYYNFDKDEWKEMSEEERENCIMDAADQAGSDYDEVDVIMESCKNKCKRKLKEARGTFNPDNMPNIENAIRDTGITNDNVVKRMAQDVAKELQEHFDKSNMSDEGLYYGISITEAIRNVIERITGSKPGLTMEGVKVKGKRKLTEAPEDEEEFEPVDEEPISDEAPIEEPTNEEEMSQDEVEDEAKEDEEDTVEDDVEQPFYATMPEFDELRDVLVDLDYRLLLINDNMVVIGRLNGPDVEILTSNEPNASTETEVSEQNEKADEVEEKASEDGEDSYEYKWIKAPDTLEKLINQCNVIYLSPDMSDEDKEQYAGKEASQESVMNYLMNQLPDSVKEDNEEEAESTDEAPVEEETPSDDEEDKEEEE